VVSDRFPLSLALRARLTMREIAPHGVLEGAVMAAYFETLEQAEKYIHQKNRERSTIDWSIVDCQIGFLVVSAAQAHQCFPELFQGSKAQEHDL
jgi:hypothetical protein